MAHEIGHNLGMSHDHSAGCDKDGFIMSFSRGTKGETLW
jgi:predicted Zn-dependent protease